MRKSSILWVSILSLLMGGCAAKHDYGVGESKLITIKSPKLKFSDMGYVRSDGNAVEVELFAAGMAVEKIAFDGEVCTRSGCMSEEKFVRDYLYSAYPRDTMRNILLGRDIFAGEGKEEMCDGRLFQFIRNDDMDIIYRRGGGEIYFRDRLNSLIVKITDWKENNATE